MCVCGCPCLLGSLTMDHKGNASLPPSSWKSDDLRPCMCACVLRCPIACLWSLRRCSDKKAAAASTGKKTPTGDGPRGVSLLEVAVMFGGQNDVGAVLGDLWEFRFATVTD